MAYEVTERDVAIGDVRLHWAEAGVGEPTFLLVHGLGSSVVKWLDSMPLLARAGRVVALDMPGFGQSDAPPGPYSPEWLAGGVRAFMDAVEIDRAIVIGNSLGGTVALWLSAAWPKRVRAQVLVAPALPSAPGQRNDFKVLSRFLALLTPGVGEAVYWAYMNRLSPEQRMMESLQVNCADASCVSEQTRRRLIEEEISRARRPDIGRARLSAQRKLAVALSARRATLERLVREVNLPTLFVWGDKDRMLPPAVGEHWVTHAPGAELVVLPGVGHNPQIEVPAVFANAVLAFVRKLQRETETGAARV